MKREREDNGNKDGLIKDREKDKECGIGGGDSFHYPTGFTLAYNGLSHSSSGFKLIMYET